MQCITTDFSDEVDNPAGFVYNTIGIFRKT